MYKLYQKNALNFALIWIGIYCVVQSVANGLSKMIGIPQSANAVLALLQSGFMLYWLRKNGLMRKFGLNKPDQSAKNMLFYLPLILVSTSNLWLGFRMNLTPAALFFHILLMLSVGFLEELIFRGFLFEALRKDSLRSAVVISSLTFGAGHIVNLFNGRGMSFTDVIFQILFAILFGFLVVMIYLRSGSLIPCILSHQAINILSAFANRQGIQRNNLIINAIEAVIIVLYLWILSRTAPIREKKQD